MTMAKRGLLIASSFDGLQGPTNDIRSMKSVLLEVGFDDITLCEGDAATKQGILDNWRNLTKRTQSNDTVVVYYSGHGGLVKPPLLPQDETGAVPSNPRQFIVPTDFGATSPHDFRGILDAELSALLRETSAATANVTLILDCCHSGSMARDPGLGLLARQRSLGKIEHHALLAHQALLETQNQLSLDKLDNTTLNQAVRVFAVVADEKAWEYADDDGNWAGAMTCAFVQTLRTMSGTRSTWKATLARVRELVGVRFPQQHPHVEGPEQRRPFELETADDSGLPLRADEDGDVWILEGKLHEVYKGNVYSVLPACAKVHDPMLEMAKATVKAVEGFKALVELSPSVEIPPEGAAAFLERLALPEWPVAVSAEVPEGVGTALRECVQRSKFVCLEQDKGGAATLAEFHLDGEYLVLYDKNGVEVSAQQMPKFSGTPSKDLFASILKTAEQMARAQHLLALTGSLDPESKLNNHLEIQMGIVKDRIPVRQVECNGTGRVRSGERIYIRLRNHGRQTIYVSVFSVNVAGTISRVSQAHAQGIPIEAGNEATIGENFGRLKGVLVSWPEGIVEAQPVVDSLVFIQTDAPVDLSHLNGNSRTARGKSNGLSRLERLTDAISTAEGRDVREDRVASHVRYAVEVVNLTLDLPQAVTVEALPTPEEMERKIESPYVLPRGWLGHINRAARGIPAQVWIVNQHSEPITVVVSQFRPNWTLDDFKVEGSATGAALGLHYTMWDSKATKKVCQPTDSESGSLKYRFPLPTRRDGFGVISIFAGRKETLVVENDHIPLGATAYFVDGRDLRIQDYSGKWIE